MAQSYDFINKIIFICVCVCVCVVSVKLIIVGDLVCRARLTHRGPGHPFLGELSSLQTYMELTHN